MATDKKLATWRIKIAELSNRVYYQDLSMIKTLPSGYRKSHSDTKNY
jgi:hypothetical protein